PKDSPLDEGGDQALYTIGKIAFESPRLALYLDRLQALDACRRAGDSEDADVLGKVSGGELRDRLGLRRFLLGALREALGGNVLGDARQRRQLTFDCLESRVGLALGLQPAAAGVEIEPPYG